MEDNQNDGLKRELGVWDVATNVVNISIASGIFLLPALIAGLLGNASILAYLVCGLMVLLIALCYAEVGSRITTSGGSYAYIEKAFGPYFGFIANGFLWFGTGVLVSAALINGIADMLTVPYPIFNLPIYRGILFFLLFSFYAFINMIGIKQGMIVIKTVTLIKIIPLVLIVIFGIFKLNPANLQWEGFPNIDKLGAASIILFFAFIGGETALNISGEMKNPSRTAPLGLILGVICIVVFFSLLQIVAQSTLGKDLLQQKAPLAAVAGELLGNWGTKMLIICGVIAIFSSLNSIVLVSSRAMFAGAKDGLLPSFLSKIHPKYATPHLTILTFCIISFLMAFSGGFKQLLILATLSTLFLYVGVALSAIKFRFSKDLVPPATFKLPGGLSIPLLTLIILAWFIFQSKQEEIIAMGIFLLVLTVIYFLKVFIQSK